MFDFERVYNRVPEGASKWLKMKKEKPTVREDVVPMSVADMDFPTPPVIVRAIQEYVKEHVLGYSRVTLPYQKAVQEFLASYHNYHIETDWIITTPGIVNALGTAVRAFTEQGDGVIVMTPIYPPFIDVVVQQGRQLRECPLRLINNRYELDVSILEKLAAEESTKLLLLCSPHNPGGLIWSKEDLVAIQDIADRYDLIVVSDEIHADIKLVDKKHYMYGSLGETAANRAIICVAASKSFNIAGLQCSSIIIKNEALRNRFLQVNEAAGIERANVLGLVATRAAYEQGLPWLEELLSVLRTNYAMVEAFFASYGTCFDIMRTEAGFLVWISFAGCGMEHDAFMQLLQKADFFVNNGKEFGHNGIYHFRVNIGLPTKELANNLERLALVLAQANIK